MLAITRYAVKNKLLAPWIKFIWHFEAEDANVFYKLLPTDCIDIILNLSSNLIYEVDANRILAAPFHINGLRSKHSYVKQVGNIRIFGISFYPFGLYPFVNQSVESIRDRVVDLQELSATLAQNLELAISGETTTENIIDNIERALILELKVTEDYKNKARLIRNFLELDNDTTIQEFCLDRAIHTKTFTRNVLNYTGYTPKTLRSLKRFQKAGNQLVYQEQKRLSDVAYENDFADQSHFTREFQKFSGVAPGAFLREKVTVKENTEYIYC
jgi:AraC-like DNA-binding protein